MLAKALVAVLLIPAWAFTAWSQPVHTVKPVLATESVSADADDPAIWVHPTDPTLSLLIGTNKAKAPEGGLALFDLNGRLLQTVEGIDRPNNVDVEYGMVLGGTKVDIVVCTERYKSRLRVFAVDPLDRRLTDVSCLEGLTVFAGQEGEMAACMGVALYRRPSDGAIFAIVSRKQGPSGAYLWQYRLSDDGNGRVRAHQVRQFGNVSAGGEIEAVAVDDELGYVYYADEGYGIRKYHADPEHPDAGTELCVFARDGFTGDREGIAVYNAHDGTGLIVCCDQIKGDSKYHCYLRQGEPGLPNDQTRVVSVIAGGADDTDGIEATSRPLGDRFPAGLLIVMNSRDRNFLVYDWRDVAP